MNPKAVRRTLFWSVVSVLALYTVSWFIFPIMDVQVTGNQRLKDEEVMKLAKAEPGSSWLWMSNSRASALGQHPWVQNSTIEKVFPNLIRVHITERIPLATLKTKSGLMVYSADAQILPDAASMMPEIEITNPSDLRPALQVAYAMRISGIKAQWIALSPAGIRVRHEYQQKNHTIWASSIFSLRKYMSSIKMYAKEQRLSIYPWGVSVDNRK